MKIKLDKIISIQVSYEAVPMLFYGTNGYNVIFKVLMKDGSSFSFQPIVTRKRKEVIDAIEFLKSKGIIFKDKYHILDQLDKQEALSYYLEKYMEVKMISIACNIQGCYFEIIKNTLPQRFLSRKIQSCIL